ncbi:MAG: chromosome segregation protein SMC [Dokdonella sp.]
MRLSTIKLSGFKSFVDPTTLQLPSNMTAIVGPNGCGKSNIIDAIRWVLGESAASRLRGDSLTDVIFSGSSSRKPVGSATVELFFDNSDGGLLGEYAGFGEISIKRLVSRDGQSLYFLNGTRCRRRDIADVFLGTGLGPRSYSIIEQGMISQIIDADPEQLRSHLEEAAGISKYKERRKETESRIKATRENLDRVRDVRDEVEKQLEHLNRQARAAERWKGLKADQLKKEAELKAMTLREAQGELATRSSDLRTAETGIEETLAGQREREAQIEASRTRHTAASEQLNAVQGEVYRVGADIARVEQQIQHSRQLAEQMERARLETERAHREISEHLAADNEQLERLRGGLEEALPQLQTLQGNDEAHAEALRVAETTLAEWQAEWETHTQTSSDAGRAAEVERTRLDYLDKQSLEGDRRREALANEKEAANLDELAAALERMEIEQGTLKSHVEERGAGLEKRRLDFETLLEREKETQSKLSQRRGELEQHRGRLSSLEALQHDALSGQGSAAADWLQRLGLDRSPRLGEALQVDAGWETAVETVLDGWLEAVLVDAPNDLGDELAALDDANLGLVRRADGDADYPSDGLATRVRGPKAARDLLAHVHVADSLEAANHRVNQLAANESIITRDGVWVGAGYARIVRGKGTQSGVIARERDIVSARARITELETETAEMATALDAGKQARIDAEQARDDAQRELYQTHRRAAEVAGQLQSQRGRLEGSRERLLRVDQELAELTERLDSDREQARDARSRLDTVVLNMGDLEQRRHLLEGNRRQLLEAREEARMVARESRDQAHQLALSIEAKRSSLASLEQAVLRMGAQMAQLGLRRDEVVAQLATSSDPLAGLDLERQTCLSQRLLVDKQLVEARKGLEDCDGELRRLEQQRQQFELALGERREKLVELRMAEQENRIRAQALVDAITQAGFEIEGVLEALPADASADQWNEALHDLQRRIERLEPVNLAAIAEHDEHSQRKDYLDAQLNDLTTALETLEGVIRKIDKETRQRFRETYDQVNAGVQELFPRLFGGGHAYLELTGDDLLSTGVTIMARPPGKRVSSITLLSGGEKALTAVALVFAIFRLNPAPFCLLDEVDAPLDEANVGRFTSLVTEMSERVQFVFVSHNKATMEAATQLCGVTMREPGVSRLVQVDLAEAAKLVGAT